MEFERVLSGFVKYVRRVIMPTMNDWQKMTVRILLTRLMRSGKEIKEWLGANFFIKTFGFIKDDNHVDLEGLIKDMKAVFAETPTIEVSIPLYGTLKFNESDVDELYRYITEE